MTDSNPPSSSLPEVFQTHILNLYGQEGRTWLKHLPRLRESLRKQWSLKNTQPVDQLSYNYLEYALSPKHGPVVLKIGFPNWELETEIQSLTLYRGREGAVQLLEVAQDQGAFLLERVVPGHDLTAISDDEKATRIAASSMLKLRLPAPDKGDFPSLGDWFQAFSRYRQAFPGPTGPLPAQVIAKASRLVQELLTKTENDSLLHGDFHHGNLLYRNDGSWVMIDPKGVRGDFAAEIGPYLFNPFPDLYQRANLEMVLDRRLRIFAEMTGLDFKRLAAWSFCRTVLAAAWSIEEGDDQIDPNLRIINILGQMVD